MNKRFKRYQKLLALSMAALSGTVLPTSGCEKTGSTVVNQRCGQSGKGSRQRCRSVGRAQKKWAIKSKIDKTVIDKTVNELSAKMDENYESLCNMKSGFFLINIMNDLKKLKDIPENLQKRELLKSLAYQARNHCVKYTPTMIESVYNLQKMGILKSSHDEKLTLMTNKLYTLTVENLITLRDKFKIWLQEKSRKEKHEIMDYLENTNSGMSEMLQNIGEKVRNAQENEKNEMLTDVLYMLISRFWTLSPALKETVVRSLMESNENNICEKTYANFVRALELEIKSSREKEIRDTEFMQRDALWGYL